MRKESHEALATSAPPVAGNTTHTAPENRIFYPALDGVRALAFTIVFLQHYAQLPWGWTGVDVFFVLSGFLITGILFDSRNNKHRLRNFYVRRTLRIFPLYYGVMLALLISFPFFHWQWSWTWLTWPAYVGNFARFFHPYADSSPMQRMADFQPVGVWGHHAIIPLLGHFWSLCIEEQFYLIWPWLVFFIRDRRKLMWICASAVPICLILRLAGQSLLPTWMLDNEILYRVTPFRVDALLLGGFLALWLRGKYANQLIRAAHVVFPFALAVAILIVILIPGGHILRKPYPYPSWKFSWGLTGVDLLSALLLLACLRNGSVINRIFSLRPLRWLGRISYGAYVLHDIPHALYLKIGQSLAPHDKWISGLLVLGISFLGTILLAWLSFRFYESPFLELKERWTIRETDRRPRENPVCQTP